MKKTTLFILCFSIFAKMGLAQNWYEQYYSTPNVFTSINCQLKISDSDFLIAGTTLDANGDHSVLTLNRLNGENDPSSVWYKTYNLGYNAEPTKIVKLSDGSYVIAGTLSPLNSYSKIFALKINSSGAVLWSKTYSYKYGEALTDMLVDGSNVLLVGTTVLEVTSGKTDIYFLKISSTGSIVTKKSFGTKTLDEVPSVITKGNSGEYLIAGTQENKSILLRINTSGTILMAKKYNISSWANTIKAIKYVSSNEIYLIGYNSYPHNSYGETFIIKINNAGTILSKKAYTLGMKIDNVAFNSNYTAIIGKADINAGENGFKFVVFDVNFNIFGSNHFQDVNNNGAMQTLVSVKKADRYYLTVKTPEINGANIYHILTNENGYGCSSLTFTPTLFTFTPTVTTLSFANAANGSSNNISVISVNKTYPLTFSCEVIVDLHKDLTENTENATIETIQSELAKTVVFPTVTTGEIHIKSTTSNYNVRLYDLYGKLVFSKINNSLDGQLDLTELNNGIYFLNIEKENVKKETFKIIKTN